MSSLLEGVNAVQRNLSALMIYIIFAVITGIAVQVVNWRLGIEFASELDKETLLIYKSTLYPLYAITYALAQTMAWTRIGSEMANSQSLFEKKWQIFLVCLMINLALNLATENTMTFFVGYVISIPVCACIMFAERFRWNTIVEDLAPLSNQFPGILVIFIFNCMLFFLWLILLMQVKSNKLLHPIIDMIFAYFECVVFAAVWHICMINKQE